MKADSRQMGGKEDEKWEKEIRKHAMCARDDSGNMRYLKIDAFPKHSTKANPALSIKNFSDSLKNVRKFGEFSKPLIVEHVHTDSRESLELHVDSSAICVLDR
jgi:hypothetical protein